MKRWSLVITSVLAIVFAGYSGYLSSENQRLKRQLANADTPTDLPVKVSKIDAPVDTSESADSGEERRFGRGEEFQNMTREEMMKRRTEMRAEQLARALKAFEDPELRMDMVERQMERLDRGYADFFKRLNLSPEEIDALKTLMAERTIVRMEAGIRASAATDEERKALKEDYANQMALLSDDINQLLGEEDAVQLAQYTNTLKYRGEVENFERSLSYTNTPLSEGQSEGLVNAFAKVDQDFEYSVDINKLGGRGRGEDSPALTKDIVDTYYQEREMYDAMLLEQASQVLNEAQLANLAQQQVAERERDYRQAQQALENPLPTDGRGGFRGGFGGFTGRGGSGGNRGGPSGGRGR